MASGAFVKNMGKIDYSSGSFRVVIYDAGYAPDLDADETLDDIPGAAQLLDEALTHTFVDGLFDATDITFTGVPAGATPTGGAIYRDASPASLIWNFDDPTEYPGLGDVTDGSDVVLAWPNDANKIFRMVNE